MVWGVEAVEVLSSLPRRWKGLLVPARALQALRWCLCDVHASQPAGRIFLILTACPVSIAPSGLRIAAGQDCPGGSAYRT